MTNNNKKTIFSGVQPSGNLHIGNYIGAISQWVKMQAEYDCIFCVVDYHAITVKQDPKELKKRIIEIAKLYLASGINPKKSLIFQQSDIKEHTELAWILNCITKISDLEKMTQFKDKAEMLDVNKILQNGLNEFNGLLLNTDDFSKEMKNQKVKVNEIIDHGKSHEIIKFLTQYSSFLFEGNEKIINSYRKALASLLNALKQYFKQEKAGVGLFDYPVLMAADILLYNTDVVPVGDDQVQHVELTRDLAKRFNYSYGQTFKIPEVVLRKEGARIMGLDNPEKKMSKSATSEANYIALLDKPEVAVKKIMRAVTDSGKEVIYDKAKKSAISNLLTIYSILEDVKIKDLEKKYANSGYGEFKKDLAEVVKKFLIDFQEKFNSISDKDVRKILDDGANKLRPIAEKTVNKAKEKIGIS